MTDLTYSSAELMIINAARLLRDGDAVFVGVGQPNLACNLAKRTHAPNLVMIYEAGVIGAEPARLPLSIGDPTLVSAIFEAFGTSPETQAASEVLIPAGPKIAVTGGLDFNDHRHLSGRGARRFSAGVKRCPRTSKKDCGGFTSSNGALAASSNAPSAQRIGCTTTWRINCINGGEAGRP